MTQPTLFGMNGNNAMIGGEAGAEAVAPIDTLLGYVETAVRGVMAEQKTGISMLHNTLRALNH